ncbi:hypothetical protein PPYR_12896 [Photinus pyralis]|uniref:cyclin-dependent kinase n=1 Tax=Photinus pyralis TaxID=7054 RepID=A0A5N4A7H1_PHOPY|nr:cyclin-dependent kinase-like 2 isoform X1 [Photinus pyralis]XP_031354053.1 cyclin-dependent kinase-like 2 isoform X1 [Photinus pyralis]XP_031354054.1 cyclin-dependent kinase-like 2 isoform X1 [Photinus pyralis]XP_031354055.1 cyclin-dependent kinase-like 2 isoform X1 [Photinus pyralis]KAB0793276.1 hypothetical protein PPYR_12896 [Photinus pyralis]
MDRYEQLAVVGEGSYGLVMKCRHKDTEQIVAIKKFLETEEDATVRKMALREIRMLKRLKHENLVTMIEVFRYRKRFYLVFEYLEGTVLDELERCGGLDEEMCRERIFQVTRAVQFCHANNVIHRDIKPENVLVSSQGVVKLCDFGFARLVSLAGEQCTEYVATRWYRAPELLVNEPNYGAPVDIWSIGCLFAEMMTGDPLFPGDSDIDQLYITIKLLGKPCLKHLQLMTKSDQLRGLIKSAAPDSSGLQKNFAEWEQLSLNFLASCLRMDPNTRPSADDLLRHKYFTHDRFAKQFLPRLREKIIKEFNENPLLRKMKADIINSTDRSDRCEEAKLRKQPQSDVPKWRINFSEGSIKRKLSCDTSSTCDNYNNVVKSETNPYYLRLSKQTSLHTMLVDKVNREGLGTPNVDRTIRTPNSDLRLIEKHLENLSKLSQKAAGDRPLSNHKDGASHKYPASPPRFQSLQPTLCDVNKSPLFHHPQNVLHPTINNICFTKAPPNKSPNALESISNPSVRSTFNQIPFLNPSKSQQFVKKTDRNPQCDVLNLEPFHNNTTPVWMHGLKSNASKYKTKKEDEFTLPNLPGVLTPIKVKKKGQMSPDSLIAQAITPDRRYKKAKRKCQPDYSTASYRKT